MVKLKHVIISVSGSYDLTEKIGSYKVQLQYKEHTKEIDLHLFNISEQDCIINGLIKGVELLNQPCHVELNSPTNIKGTPNLLIDKLIKLLQSKECKYTFITSANSRTKQKLQDKPKSLKSNTDKNINIIKPKKYEDDLDDTWVRIPWNDPRKSTEMLEKCPHNVLKIKKCAICDPEGHALENGW